MDLDFTEEQHMLRDTVRGLCNQHAPIAAATWVATNVQNAGSTP
jgi:hypothetical protein